MKLTKREHDHAIEAWWDRNSRLTPSNEQLLEYLFHYPEVFRLFKDNMSGVIPPTITLEGLNTERYQVYITWFKADDLRVKAFEDWLAERVPDFEQDFEND